MAVELKDIEAALEGVLLPQPKRSIVQLNMVRDIQISDETVKLDLSLTPLADADKENLRQRVRAAVEGLTGVKKVEIDVEDLPPHEMNQFDRVIAIMSGKGGVGKSLVTGLLAVALSRQGQQVGIWTPISPAPASPRCSASTRAPWAARAGYSPWRPNPASRSCHSTCC